jgi:hypothetical protein
MKYLFSLVIATVVLSSCTTVYFEHPQPKNDSALNGFPKSFQGAYFIEEGQQKDTLLVEKNKFIYPERFKKSLPLSSLDTIPSMRIFNGLLYDDVLPINYGIPFTQTSDSIHYNVTVKIAKTLSDSLILKKFGNLLVLNEKEEKTDFWNTYLIEKLKNGNLQVLAVGNFKTEDSENQKGKYDGELKDFLTITPFTKLGENSYVIDPDKEAFDKLYQKGFFKEAEVYKKIK